MTLAALLTSAESTEEIFEALEVEYDPKVLTVHRLQILKRLGELVAALGSDLDEVTRVARERRALETAYSEFASEVPPKRSPFEGVSRGLIQLRKGR